MAEGIEELVAEVRRLIGEVRDAQSRPAAYTFSDAAKALSCSEKHLRRMVATGHILACSVGSLRRIPATEIERLTRPTVEPVKVAPRAKRAPAYSAAAEFAKFKARAR